MRQTIQRVAMSRPGSTLLLCAGFWIVASAGFSGFFAKWALRDGMPRFGIERMLDATAEKPFVYRQLVPMLSKLTAGITPEAIQRAAERVIRPEDTFARATVLAGASPELRLRYTVVYYLCFICLFLSLFVLRQIVLDAGGSAVAGVFAPAALVLGMPYLQTEGGYFYDCSELLFLSLAFLAASRGKTPVLLVLSLVATLNKETFFFFVPALYPLLRTTSSAKGAAVIAGAALLTAGAVNVLVKLAFRDAPGYAGGFFLIGNLQDYLWPGTYGLVEPTYGILGPGGASVATLGVIALVVLRGWPACSHSVRQHLLVAAAINVPVFLASGGVGELRALSLLFVGFVVVLAAATDRLQRDESARSTVDGAFQLHQAPRPGRT